MISDPNLIEDKITPKVMELTFHIKRKYDADDLVIIMHDQTAIICHGHESWVV